MTPTQQDPDEIRREIDRTRGRLTEDVDVLAESVRPSSVARRTTQRAGSRAAGLRDRVMGTAHDVAGAGGDTAHGATDAVREVPGQVRETARGNPLAAGAVALAAGWLVGSLLPPSAAERRLAASAAEKAQPLVDEVKSVAGETAGGLQESAQEAVRSVRDTASDSVSRVKDEGSSAAQDVTQEAKEQTSSGG
ncbi:DUF3618 domain-containing protein [Phycicoccus jejuensis]|uniref:DUF3618 domain-containing protein n=1 Tax=Phycicoccus jejuensis TaxID=367299 RepID=UPI0004C37361|nr:DUF3618 domain-containing protein [Phycicoccus jejuensis]